MRQQWETFLTDWTHFVGRVWGVSLGQLMWVTGSWWVAS